MSPFKLILLVHFKDAVHAQLMLQQILMHQIHSQQNRQAHAKTVVVHTRLITIITHPSTAV